VSWGHQISSCDLVSATHEKCGHGYHGGQCSPHVWHALVKILDKETWGNIIDGPHILYHSSVWRGA
jgi:hypothetical protein